MKLETNMANKSQIQPTKWDRLFNQRFILLLIIIFLAGIAGMVWNLSRLSSNLIKSTALQDADRYANALATFRTLYTSEVVARVVEHNIDVTHDYLSKDGAIPLPATLSIELGKQIGESGGGVQMRLYSDYPFPWRKNEDPPDDFEQEALRYLRQNPDEPFVRFEEINGRTSLRYATADLMRSDCVDCHNTHPDSPKTDWQEGDVRGVLEVIRPLDNVAEHTSAGLQGTFITTGFMALFGVIGLVVAFVRLRQNSIVLEERAHILANEINERKQAQAKLAKANLEILNLGKRLKIENLRLSAKHKESGDK